MMDFTPELTNIHNVKISSDCNRIMSVDMILPWPMYKRKMLMSVAVAHDYANKGIMSICKGVDEDYDFFGVKPPKVDTNEFVLQDTKYLYHFF